MGNHETLLTVYRPSGGRPLPDFIQGSTPPLFVPLEVDEQRRYEKAAPVGSFGPYRTGRQQARHVDLWITPVSTDSQESDPAWTVAVRVVARVRSAAGVRWWALQVPADTAQGYISGTAPLRVGPVESGAALPILIASFDTAAHGHTAEIVTSVKLALDFRATTPRALARIECSSSDTRQSCTGGWGHKDTSFWTGTSVDCSWSVKRNGFVCRFSGYAGTDWGGRFWSSHVDLARGTPLSVPPLEASRLLGVCAPIASGASGEPGKARFADVGTLTRLAVFESRVKGRSLCLLAARGAGLSFDPRFFLLRVDAGQASAAADASLEELKLHDPDPRAPDADHEAWPGPPAATPDRAGPDFGVTRVPGAASNVHLLDVVATEGAGRGLYRVGIEDEAMPVAGAARLASDIAYPFCGGRTHPASAVRISSSEGGALQLDMEPAYFDLGDAMLVREIDEQRIARQCPWTAHLRWQDGQGFAWEDEMTSCEQPTAPRQIRIGPDGRIDVVPLEAP